MKNRIVRAILFIIVVLIVALAFFIEAQAQCYTPTDSIRSFGCSYIDEVPPIAAGTTVTRCYELNPESDNIQPGFIIIQSAGCGPLAYTDLTYELWTNGCGELLESGSIFPTTLNPVAGIPYVDTLYVLCFTWTALCQQNAVCATYYFSPLPIELLSFVGSEFSGGIALEWVTGSELNTDHFIVERSEDMGRWSTIHVSQAAGHTIEPRYYGTIDNRPMMGVNYYRLTECDTDGSETIVATIAVHSSRDAVRSFLWWYNLAGQRIR